MSNDEWVRSFRVAKHGNEIGNELLSPCQIDAEINTILWKGYEIVRRDWYPGAASSWAEGILMVTFRVRAPAAEQKDPCGRRSGLAAQNPKDES